MRLACRLVCLVGWSGLATLTAGCSSPNWSRSIPWLSKTETPATVADRWTERVLHQRNGGTTRGFLGRVMFYPATEKSSPTKVDGDLIVYAFDEQGRKPTDHRPDRKFVFTAEQLANHYHESKLGPSYDIWLPWDPVGGPRKRITLIVRFQPVEGGLVIGQPSTQILSGPVTESSEDRSPLTEMAARARLGERIRQVAYEEAQASGEGSAPSPPAGKLGLKTTTIDLPPQFCRTPRFRVRRTTDAGASGPAVSPRLPPAESTQAQTGSRQGPPPAGSHYPTTNPPFAPPPPTRFERPRPRVLGGPIVRPRPDRAPTRPTLGAPPPSPPSSRWPAGESESGWRPETAW